MKLIVTIDTEEDNWGCYTPVGHTVENIERIPALQELFNQFNVKPTYLVDYPVVSNDRAASILKALLVKGNCEIGTHCHPWNTPPFQEITNERNSMLCNLPRGLQYRKIRFLHDAIRARFGVDSISFRCGRWGFAPDIARHLCELGYKIDTSIIPYTNWTREHGPDFSDVSPRPFKFSFDDICKAVADGPLVEVPATVGFLQSNFSLCSGILKLLTKKPLSRIPLQGIFYKLNILNQVWLSPEVADTQSMVRLARRMMTNNYPVINLFFHSPSLKYGLSPFVRTKSEEATFLQRIREFLSFAREVGIDSMTLSGWLCYQTDTGLGRHKG
jgi:hypothetical protein